MAKRRRSHGKVSTYASGCRCARCRAAKAAANKAYKNQRAASEERKPGKTRRESAIEYLMSVRDGLKIKREDINKDIKIVDLSISRLRAMR